MNLKKIFRGAVCACLLGFFAFSAQVCSAEIVEGRAPIINGDVSKARTDAMNDARRTCIEMKVGVRLQSQTEVSMGMVVSDTIMVKSDGYVQTKKILEDKQQGDVYYVKLDLEANDKMIDVAVEDVKSRLEALDDTSSRSAIMVAVSGHESDGSPIAGVAELNDYVSHKLQNIGFKTVSSQSVANELSRANMSDPGTRAKIRSTARADRLGAEATAVLYGTLSTMEVQAVQGGMKAVVRASFELVGLESDETNSFSEYFAAVAATASEAKRKADDAAVRAAADALGQKALRTVQRETRGGVRHIKASLVFKGITDRKTQPLKIAKTLREMGMKVLRAAFGQDGNYHVYVDAAFETTGDLSLAVAEKLGVAPDAAASDSDTKIYFSF